MATPTTALERQLPQNTEAERSILGAILLDNNTLNATLEKLKPEDFFHDHHRRIYQQMIALGETQQAIDLVTLTDQLHRRGELESSGGPAYIAQLMDGTPHVTNIEHYMRIVKEKSLSRPSPARARFPRGSKIQPAERAKSYEPKKKTS